MSRYNTGNPVGSKDLKDLSDNLWLIDEFTNSDAELTKNRLSVDISTLAGINAKAMAVVDSASQAVSTAITETNDKVHQLVSSADDKINSAVASGNSKIEEMLAGGQGYLSQAQRYAISAKSSENEVVKIYNKLNTNGPVVRVNGKTGDVTLTAADLNCANYESGSFNPIIRNASGEVRTEYLARTTSCRYILINDLVFIKMHLVIMTQTQDNPIEGAESYMLISGFPFAHNSHYQTILGQPYVSINAKNFNSDATSYYAYIDDKSICRIGYRKLNEKPFELSRQYITAPLPKREGGGPHAISLTGFYERA